MAKRQPDSPSTEKSGQKAGKDRGRPAGKSGSGIIDHAADEDILLEESLNPGLLPTGTANLAGREHDPEQVTDLVPEALMRETDEVLQDLLENKQFDQDPTIHQSALKSYSGDRRVGGPTGRDFAGGGSALGKIHPTHEEDTLRIGSREETEAALEREIATRNTRTLHEPNP